jgi:8-hydroxy-5-deazaflavin:NADPH oxidoreductase
MSNHADRADVPGRPLAAMADGLPSVGIVGSGPVGTGIAVLLASAKYRVTLGTRNPAAKKFPRLPAEVRVGTFEDAAAAPTVFIALVHGAAADVVARLKDQLAGKVLIDTMNAWIRRDYVAAGLSDHLTEGSWLAGLLPGTAVTRAFSHIDRDRLVPAALSEPGVWAAGYAADDESASETTASLIRDMGYVPVLVGPLAESAPLDVGGILFPRMLTPRDMRALLSSQGKDSSPA